MTQTHYFGYLLVAQKDGASDDVGLSPTRTGTLAEALSSLPQGKLVVS